MSPGAWLRQPVVAPTGLECPRWVPLGVTACALAVALGSLAQRGALLSPGRDTVLVVLAVSPWLIECAGRRSLPAPVFAALVLAGTVGLVLDPARSDVVPFLLVVMAVQVGAVSAPAVTAGVVVVSSAAMVALAIPERLGGWWVWVPGIVAGAVGGFGAQAQVRLLAREREMRTELAGRLAAEQRRQVAREVHDVIAHSLGVTMLYLTAARHTLESVESEADVDEAVDSLREAERLGRQAMGDIRRTVGLLDAGQGGAPDARPLPGVADLPTLVGEFACAGIDVHYRLEGDVEGLSPTVGLALYRVAEESLANVVRHAPGGCAEVAVDARRDPIELRIDSTTPDTATPAAADAGGRGIRGMHERVELLGGAFRAGTRPGGWQVVARFPRHPARSADAPEAAGAVAP